MKISFRKIFRYGLAAIAVGSGLVVMLNLWVLNSSRGDLYETVSEVPERDVAVVLGTSRLTKNGYVNQFFKFRMDAAAELYHAGKVKKILVSGDNGQESYDEATDMRDALIARGVPQRDIVLDYAGFRTLDSVVRARDVFGQNDPVFVSQRFHLQRTLFIAGTKKMEGVGFVADDVSNRRTRLRLQAREVLARVAAWLDCFVLFTKPKFPGPPEPIQV